MENTPRHPIHVGHNIQKFRLLRGYSQAGLAHQLEQMRNKPMSQQLMSDIEDREAIEDEELLKQIAEALGTSPEILKNLDLDDAINIIGNHFHEYSTQQINFKNTVHNSQTYNPIEKLIEFFEKEKAELKAEIEKLKKEKK